MAKQLNVNLAFTADTTQARQQLQQLQNQLNSIISGSTAKQLGFDTEINKGIDAAARLKLALQEATNATTGKLDLGKFDQQIKKSGMTIKEYGANLAALGPKGQEAFISLARSISNAEIPLTRVNSKITELGVVLKNTLKWQISSSVLHGFMSAISGAYQYAQDLNESLNNIRIVTGQSAEEMDKFAARANKAAKALNASTTEYTNAALIYYQQGLADEEVLKRTNTTIKLANVSRESAETVSEWMTAIWNNFDDGTRSLESYADTITALGAATASSADEIAEGLEKFSAIAETVGLSYDYATAALATVTSQTRQSADVVGTAFKTLFARLEGLKLGETLEDGVTLNQYSEGLAAIGINILNANGELKDMDVILDQLGSRWDTLSKAQQVALAQTVGGIRQYNQLISLMDNWDTFQQNLTIAQTSEGALQEQADIYAESWEGAQKRVKASAEAIYSDLLDDDFFIDLLNGFSHILDTINSLIDSLGGAKGVLLTVSTLLLQMTGPKIAKGLETMALNMKYFLNPAKAQADAKAIKDQMWKTASIMSTDTGTQAGAAQGAALQQEAKLQRYLLENASQMSETEQAIYKLRMDNVRALQEANIEHAKAVDLLDKQKEQAGLETARTTATGQSATSKITTEQAATLGISYHKGANANLESVHTFADTMLQSTDLNSMNLNEAQTRINELLAVLDEIGIKIPQELQEAKTAIDNAIDSGETGTVDSSSAKRTVKQSTTKLREKGTKTRDTLENTLGKEGLKALDKEVDLRKEAIKANEKYSNSSEKIKEAGEELLNNSKDQIKVQREWSTTMVNAAQGISSLAMGLSVVGGFINTVGEAIKTGEIGFEDLLGIFMSLGMAIPMVMNGITSLGTAMGITTAITVAATAAEKGYTKEKRDQAVLTALGITLKEGETAADSSSIAVRYAVAASEAFANREKRKGILLSIAAKAAKLLEAIGLGGLIPLEYADAAAKGASAAATWALLAPIGLLLLAIGGLVGTIALVVAGFKALSDAYNADAIAAEKAREEAKALADAYGEVKEKYEELKQTIADYKDAQDAIDQLKQGTQEWRDAVSEANLEILNLLDKYPELAQYVQTLEGGRMIIAEEGLAKVLNQEAENVAIMANMSTMANHRANVAETKAKRTDLVRNELTMKDSNVGWAVGLTATGVLAPIGAALAIADAAQTSNMENFLDKLSQEYMDVGETAFVGLEDRLKDLGVSSDDAAQEVRKLIVEQQNLAETEKIIAQQQVDNLLMSQAGFNTKDYTSGIQEQAKRLSDQIVAGQNFSADAMHQYSNWNLAWQLPLAMAGPGGMALGGILDATGAYIETSTELGDDTIKKYLESKGLDSDQYKGINFKGDKVVWKEKGEGDTAEWKSGELSYEALAEFAKQDYLAQNADEIAKAMNNLMATTRSLSLSNDSYEQALASYLAEGDLSMMSPEIYDKLKGASADEITRIFNENQAVFEAAGIKSADDLVKGFDEALTAYNPVTAQQNIINKKWATFKTVVAEGAKELEVSESALKSYTEILMTENKALEDNIDIAGQSAVAHFRLAKGVEKIREALEDSLGVLEEANVNSLEYAEALGSVRDAVAKTFGMEVSANFVEDNLKTIKSMTEGNVEAFKELQKLIVSDYIVNLQLEDNAKDVLQKEIDSLLNEVSGLEVKGTLTLDNTEAIAALNTALENGSTTTEEIQAMFSNMNLALPPTTITSYKKPTRTTTITESRIWDESAGKWGTSTRTENTVTSEVEIPWIGDNKPEFERDSSGAYKFDSQGQAVPKLNKGKSNAIGGLSKTAEFSSKNLKDALNYDTDAKGETARERKQRLKELNDELERYHEINEVIDDLSKEMDKLAKLEDKAFGKEKVKYMQQQLDVLEAEVKAQEVKIQQAEELLALDEQNLKNLNSAVNIDPITGNITNFTEIQASYLQRLADMSPEDKQYEKLQEEYELFMDYAAKYEETYDEVEAARVAANDKANEKIEKQLEAIDYSVEINIEINNRQIENLERLLERLDDDLYDTAERVKRMTEQTEREFSNMETAEAGIRALLGDNADAYFKGDSSALNDLTASEIEQLMKFTDQINDSEAAIYELRKEIEDQTMTTFNAWHDEIEQNGQAFEHATSMVESYKNIIDIVGKDSLGIDDAFLKDLEDMQVKAAQGSLDNAKTQLETTKNALAKAKIELENAQKRGTYDKATDTWSNQADIDKWESDIKQLNSTLMDDEEAFMSAWTNSLQVAAEVFEAQMDRAFDNLEDDLAGSFKSLDELSKAYERDQQIADRYLDGGEKLYELSKLNRQIQKNMDANTSTKAQKELLELQKIIGSYQEDGVQMSKYELDALQKKYDLKVAEIALEEAQNSKSQVRLTRDASGNFGYVYTTDETKTADAQQNYEDKLEASRQLAEDQSRELTEAIINNRQQMMDAIRELNRADFASQEEYLKEIETITEQYRAQEAYYIEEYQKTVARSRLTYAQDFADYEGWSGKKLTAAQLLKEELGLNEDQMGQNTWGFVEDYGKAMQEMCGDIGLPALSAEELNKALGTGEGGGEGYYDKMIASAAAWASGMGASSQQAAGSFAFLINGEDGEGGIVGVLAQLGNGTTTGYYRDALDNLNTFIGTEGADGTFSGYLSAAGQKFDLVNQGADTLLKNLTTEGTGKIPQLVLAGDNFKIKFNEKIGGISFSPVDTEAANLKTALGDWNTPGSFFGDVWENTDDWETSMASILGQGGTDFDNFKFDVLNALYGVDGTKENPSDDSVAGGINAARDKLWELYDNADAAFIYTNESVTAWQEKFTPEITTATDKVTNLNNALQALLDKEKPSIDVSISDNGAEDKLKALNAELDKLATNRSSTVTITTVRNDGNNQITDKIDVTSNSSGKITTGTLKAGQTYYYSGRKEVDGVKYVSLSTKANDPSTSQWYKLEDTSTTWEEAGAARGAYAVYAKGSKDPYPNSTYKKDMKISAWNSTQGSFNVALGKDDKATSDIYKQAQYVSGRGYTAEDTSKDYLPVDSKVLEVYYSSSAGQYRYKFTTKRGKTIWIPGAVLKDQATVKFDTGGYTGNWGPEGRLAMLHQKEIVLNAHDTENFLTAIGIVRDISDQIEKNAIAMQYQNQLNAYRMMTGNTGTLQQDVHITAEFPNVSDHNEIELALSNLVNEAAQWANRK